MATKSAPTVVKNYSSIRGHIIRQRPGTKYAPEIQGNSICVLFGHISAWEESFNPQPVRDGPGMGITGFTTDPRDYRMVVALGDVSPKKAPAKRRIEGDVLVGFADHEEIAKFCRDFAQWLRHSPEKKDRFKKPQELASCFDGIAEGVERHLPRD